MSLAPKGAWFDSPSSLCEEGSDGGVQWGLSGCTSAESGRLGSVQSSNLLSLLVRVLCDEHVLSLGPTSGLKY